MFLTKRQKEIHEFLDRYITKKGYAPTLEEIRERFRLSSLATVHKHLTNLERKGLIRRTWNFSRAIELLPRAGAAKAIELPLRGTVAAGHPIEAIETDDSVAIPEAFVRRQPTFVLRVRGNSMVDDGIWDGDYIIVEGRPAAESGETVVALVNGEATVKRFYRDKSGKIRLQPANEAMPALIVKAKDVVVQGVVVAVMRKY